MNVAIMASAILMTSSRRPLTGFRLIVVSVLLLLQAPCSCSQMYPNLRRNEDEAIAMGYDFKQNTLANQVFMAMQRASLLRSFAFDPETKTSYFERYVLGSHVTLQLFDPNLEDLGYRFRRLFEQSKQALDQLASETERQYRISRNLGVPPKCSLNLFQSGQTTILDSSTNLSVTSRSRYFGDAVDVTQSVVVLPVDVFQCQTSVYRDILWTRGLEFRMYKIAENYHMIGYQHFSTPSGAVRIYPASLISPPITFDPRFQPWYTQVAMPPKFVLMAIDSSGSVNGQVSKFLSKTAARILDTLTENDLINIMFFKNDYIYLLPTTTELQQVCIGAKGLWYVRGTVNNVQTMKNLILMHKNTNSTADFKIPLSRANEVFANVPSNLYCIKLLVMITDGAKGATTMAASALRTLRLQHPDMTFSLFLEGQDAYRGETAEYMKKFTCSTNGSLHTVPKEAMIRAQVAQLINFLSNGSAETEGIEVWSRVYFGHWSPTHLPVITISKPVFYKQQNSPVFDEGYNWLNPQTPEIPILVGTAAQDIHLNSFYTWTMQMGCSPHTQVFLVDVDSLYVSMMDGIENVGYLKLEVFPEIPFLEIIPEFLTDEGKSTIITKTQQGWQTTMKVQASLKNIPGHQYLGKIQEVEYKWLPLDRYPYVLVSREEKTFRGSRWHPARTPQGTPGAEVQIKNTFLGIVENPNLFQNSFKLFIDSKVYCPKATGNVAMFNSTNMMQFLNKTVFQSPDYPDVPECKESDLYWAMLSDLYLVYLWVNKQPDFMPFKGPSDEQRQSQQSSFIKLVKPETILASFLSTHSGVLAVLERDKNSDEKYSKMWQSMRRQSNSVLESARNFYPNEQENRVALQMHVAYNYHKEAPQKCFQSEEAYWEFDADTYDFPLVLNSILIPLGDPSSYTYGMMGAVLSHKAFLEWLQALFPECWDFSLLRSSSNPDLRCYILDEGAFILANNQLTLDHFQQFENEDKPQGPQMQEASIGANLHSVDYCLLQALVKEGIYISKTVRDSLCACEPDDIIPKSSSLSISPFVIVSTLLQSIVAITSSACWLLTNIVVNFDYVISLLSVLLMPSEIQALPEFKPGVKMLCQLQTTKYIYGEKLTRSSVTNCSQHCVTHCDPGRNFRAERLDQSNLIFVAVKGNHDCPCGASDPKRTTIEQNLVVIEDTLGLSSDERNRPIREYKFNTCSMTSSSSGTNRNSVKDYTSGLAEKNIERSWFRDNLDLTCSRTQNRDARIDTTCGSFINQINVFLVFLTCLPFYMINTCL